MIRRPPRSTLDRSSAASDVYKRQILSWRLRDPLATWCASAGTSNQSATLPTEMDDGMEILQPYQNANLWYSFDQTTTGGGGDYFGWWGIDDKTRNWIVNRDRPAIYGWVKNGAASH